MQAGTTHNVFGIQTGVAIGFFVRDRSNRRMQHTIARREDAELAVDKLAYFATPSSTKIAFEEIYLTPKYNWFNQTNTDFGSLIPLGEPPDQTRQGCLNDEQAVFGLYSMGAVTNRDEWVYDSIPTYLHQRFVPSSAYTKNTRAEYGGKDIQ